MLRQLLLTGLCIVFGAASSWAVEMRAQVDREVVHVAEPFWFSVVVRVPDGANVAFPEVPQTLDNFQVLQHRDWFDIPTESGQREWTRHLQLETWQGGNLQVPAQTVSVDGQSVASQPITIDVTSEIEAAADPTAFRDVKPLMEIPPPIPEAESETWKWVAGGLALAAIATLLIWQRRRPRSVSPAVWALEQLRRIQESESEGEPEEQLAEIAMVLRQYIERAWQVRATRQTTTEFLQSIRGAAVLDSGQQELLGKFLNHVDQVKFAQRQTEAGRVADSVRLVQEFIHRSSARTSAPIAATPATNLSTVVSINADSNPERSQR